MKMFALRLPFSWLVLAACVAVPAARGADEATVLATRSGGERAEGVVDGNAIHLRVVLPRPASAGTDLVFRLQDEPRATPVGQCTVPRGARECATAAVSTLGWRWDARGVAMTERVIAAESRRLPTSSMRLRIAPRPVVLVHGFMSDHRTWGAYTRQGGYLAGAGLEGYAVGDGRAPGTLSLGDIKRPTAATLTLPENAAVLASYIAAVRRASGAELVDIVAHSMGGLVARYYVARLMKGRDVAQLSMLGSPNGGSDCSGLPAALGVLGPAALELRPAYLKGIFNRGVTRRHGVPFHMLAGDPISEGFKAPCTDAPSDGVVSVDSASAIPGSVMRMAVLHTDMTASQDVFARFVLPRLQRPGRDSAAEPAQPPAPESGVPRQFTQVFTGRVAPRASVDVEVHLDRVSVASFALFDPSRSLAVTVRGASGRTIELTPEQHGLLRVDDPSSMLTLGYGFRNPQPGPWRVTLRSASDVDTEFALSAQVAGGPLLQAGTSHLSPDRRETVVFSAALTEQGRPVPGATMVALIRSPSGRIDRIALQRGGADEMRAAWRPTEPGVHGVDIMATTELGGLRVERTAFLAVDVQP